MAIKEIRGSTRAVAGGELLVNGGNFVIGNSDIVSLLVLFGGMLFFLGYNVHVDGPDWYFIFIVQIAEGVAKASLPRLG